MGDKDCQEIVPVWPHPLFAEAFAVGEWLGYKPKKIDLEEWLNKWTPGMEKDHRTVAVFPAAESQTTTASPLKLKSDLASSFSPEELYIWKGKYFCRIKPKDRGVEEKV